MVLYSKIYGNHPRHLLIFHGLLGMSDNWTRIAQILSVDFTVHVIDLRNHGRSFHHDSMSLKDLAFDVFNYVNHYKLTRFSLLGHSLGGKVAMEFVFTYYSSELLDKVIIVDIAPKAYPPHHQFIINALNTIDFNILQSRKAVEIQLNQFISDSKVVQFLLKNLFWNRDKKLDFRFNLNSITMNYNQLITNTSSVKIVNNPNNTILFVSGEQSDYILKSDRFLINQLFNNVKFETISNAGHWVHSDNPHEFIKKINFFLHYPELYSSKENLFYICNPKTNY